MANQAWIGPVGTTPDGWDVGANWASGSVPVNSDSVFIEDNSADIGTGLNQSAVTLTSLNISCTYSGDLGLAPDGLGGGYLQIASPVVQIGYNNTASAPTQGQSGRLKIDLGSTSTAVNVLSTSSSSADAGRDPVRIKCDNSGSKLNVLGGRVGIATDAPGETSTIGTINVGGSTAGVTVGAGVTWTTIDHLAGTSLVNSGGTTINLYGGTLKLAAGAVTTINVYGGTLVLNSTGTITTINLFGGTVDCLQSTVARTITTLNIKGPGAVLKTDSALVTIGTLAESGRLSLATATG